MAHDSPLRLWQEQALAAWLREGRRGIVAAATGTGKTRFALRAMEDCPADRTIVVVPTQLLQEQWTDLLRRGFQLGPQALGTIGGARPDFNLRQRMAVAVINSARVAVSNAVDYWQGSGERVLLIVDECHWAGSETSHRLFEIKADFCLGLSATPERTDDGFEDLLVPNLGPVIYRYPLRQAIDDGVLSEIVSTHLLFPLTAYERQESERIADRASSLRHALAQKYPALGSGPGWDRKLIELSASDEDAKSLVGLANRQNRLVTSSERRMAALESLISGNCFDERMTIVFCETISQAKQVAGLFERHNRPHALEHSQLPRERRQAALRRFANKSVPTLVAVKALDEGIDIPDADTALLVSGALNQRQRTQRIGRIARASETSAKALSLIAEKSPEEWEAAALDRELLGPTRVQSVTVAEYVRGATS